MVPFGTRARSFERETCNIPFLELLEVNANSRVRFESFQTPKLQNKFIAYFDSVATSGPGLHKTRGKAPVLVGSFIDLSNLVPMKKIKEKTMPKGHWNPVP